MTAELARSRGLDVYESGYTSVELGDDLDDIPIDDDYWILLKNSDMHHGGLEWRSDIPGNELADILEAGLVELEGEPDE